MACRAVGATCRGAGRAALRGTSGAVFSAGGPVELAALAAAWRSPCGSGRRGLHKGHTHRVLEKLGLPRHHWLKEVDQAPELSDVRRHKDRYLRELETVYKDTQGIFLRNDAEEDLAKSVLPFDKTEKRQSVDSLKRKEDVNEALRMYRLLRPDAAPFYEEDAMRSMQAKANKLSIDEAPAAAAEGLKALEQEGSDPLFDPFKSYLPVVNQRAFLLALESVIDSLADDVEFLCLQAGLLEEHLPQKGHPLRFKLLVDSLFGAFPLRKDPSRVPEFMDNYWLKLQNLLPKEIGELPQDVVAEWLKGHLTRVRLNQRRHAPKVFLHAKSERFGDEEWYSFAEDFPYDDDPMSGLFADERNLDFPLEKAGEYMSSILGAMSKSPKAMQLMGVDEGRTVPPPQGEEVPGSVASQFQDFVWDLEKVGLRNWLKMDVADLERFLPKGDLSKLNYSDDDVEVAKLMLRCAARGRADLLDFEAVDPYKLLHGLPAREVDEELSTLPGHDQLDDSELGALVDDHVRESRGSSAVNFQEDMERWKSEGADVKDIYKQELDFYRTSGPVEWMENKDGEYSWKWRQPPNTFWDERRKVYIQIQKNVDPNLNLKEMRQHMLDVTRMGSMCKTGKVNYFRAIVVVGNGKGVYGFGIGFGSTPKEARADASLKALQNLDYIDMDPGRELCTPTMGQEYKHSVKIIPRPIGRGVKCNKKFLPLIYILGLTNCKVKFMQNKWFTRMRALKRSLDMIISRRTLANMTGKRYALLVAPGDHWVHWPDRWFEETRKQYDDKTFRVRLARRHALHFKNRPNKLVVPQEVMGGWRKDNWIRWNNPLERAIQHNRLRSRRKPSLTETTETTP